MRAVRADLTDAEWRKSTYSNGQGGDCLEFAANIPRAVPVRDSKSPIGPTLIFRPTVWAAFVAGVRRAG